MTIELDNEQRIAIDRCVDLSTANRIVPVTGQAGTGKTTIIRQVHQRLIENGVDKNDIVLCAPTGKAAKRIQEATGIEAMTIHRLLEYPYPGEVDPKTGRSLVTTSPKRHAYNPLQQKVILADEYAMVNTETHRNLVDAMRPGSCLRIFGDMNQLRPIEENKTLMDLPTPFQQMLQKFNGVVLKTIHRQGEGSLIVKNGDRILKGGFPTRGNEFLITVTDQPVRILADFVMEMMDKGIDFGSIDNQILSPTKKSWIGTPKLNQMLQRLLNPDAKSLPLVLPRHTWDKENPVTLSKGDKVIWTRNNYDLRIFNGETGVVVDTSELGEVEIDFGDRKAMVPPIIVSENPSTRKRFEYDPRRDLDLAYAITTHKAQGSEYKHVVYVINKSAAFMLSRANTYTAVTRARENVHVICDQKSASLCVTQRK